MKKNCSGFYALLAFLLVFPLFLRRKWRVARRIIIHATPAEIFPFINDLKNWPLWSAQSCCEGRREYTYGAVTSGTGAALEWKTRRMSGAMKIVQSVQDDHVAYELELQPCKCTIEGVIALEEIDGSTRVTWLCKWESGSNPYLRYIDVIAKIFLKRELAAGLENLRKLATGVSQA